MRVGGSTIRCHMGAAARASGSKNQVSHGRGWEGRRLKESGVTWGGSGAGQPQQRVAAPMPAGANNWSTAGATAISPTSPPLSAAARAARLSCVLPQQLRHHPTERAHHLAGDEDHAVGLDGLGVGAHGAGRLVGGHHLAGWGRGWEEGGVRGRRAALA